MAPPSELAENDAVREAVLTTVTLDEALRVLRSRAGKPWCDAFLLHFTSGLDDQKGLGGDLASAGRQVVYGSPTHALAAAPKRGEQTEHDDTPGDQR